MGRNLLLILSWCFRKKNIWLSLTWIFPFIWWPTVWKRHRLIIGSHLSISKLNEIILMINTRKIKLDRNSSNFIIRVIWNKSFLEFILFIFIIFIQSSKGNKSLVVKFQIVFLFWSICVSAVFFSIFWCSEFWEIFILCSRVFTIQTLTWKSNIITTTKLNQLSIFSQVSIWHFLCLTDLLWFKSPNLMFCFIYFCLNCVL